MRKHIILFFSALLFLFACKGKNDANGIMSEGEITRLLADVHIVDGSLAMQSTGDSLYKYGTDRYLYLFKQYHTDSAQFKRSVKYYTTQPEVLIKIYDGVNKILQVKADSLNKLVAAEKAKASKAQAEALKKSQKLKQDSTAQKNKTGQKTITQPVKQKLSFKNALPK